MSVRVWDLLRGDDTLLKEYRAPKREPQKLSFSPSGKRLAACDSAGDGRIWELRVELAETQEQMHK